MNRLNYYIIVTILISTSVFAQKNIKEGKIGYISSELVYVTFDNTSGITEGDTLYLKNNKNKPALIVKYMSSSSTACERLGSNDFKSGNIVYAYDKEIKQNENEVIQVVTIQDVNEVKPVNDIKESKESNLKETESKITGRYSIQSYSNFNNIYDRGDYQRWRHSFRFGAQNIGGSDLFFSTYTIFAYKADNWKTVSSNLGKAIKVYDLNLNYKFDQSTQFWFGRYLNRKISNVSIVDGLQFEKAFSFITTGVVIGSRPNFTDFGLNTKLFEYGVYLNRLDSLGNGQMENTFSLFQQTNNLITDRRFTYFQHTNNIISNVFLFASTEVDLYKKESGIEKGDFSLTSLYLSARYSPVREFSLNLSYDARKNIYYYETFKSISDSVLENETRQGFRIRSVIRPFNRLTVGVQYGYRYSKSDAKPSENFGGNISYSMIPIIQSSIGLNFNRLISNYVDGFVYSVTLNKSLSEIRSDISVSFRKTDYTFSYADSKFDEKALILDFSTSVFNPFSFSISYEGAFESIRTYGRILFDITARF
jgi:hypothetical protein